MLLAVLFTVFVLTLACQVIPTPPPLKATPRSWITEPAGTLSPSLTGSGPPASPAEKTTRVPTAAPGDLPSFPYQPDRPFAVVTPMVWEPSALKPGGEVNLPVALEQTANRAVTDGLTMRQRTFLAQNGFVILHSQEAQFGEIRQQVADRYGQPYYLAGDTAYHAFYWTLGKLLQALEREELHHRMQVMLQATLQQTLSYLPTVQGGPLEADTRLAAAYLGVALKLFDPQLALDPTIEAPVMAQVEQIMSAAGEKESVLIPGYQDDFETYRPDGHYSGDQALEAYYRGMTWLSRAVFSLGERFPGDTPSRAPLILTLALRQATTENGPADQEWAQVYEALSFFSGPGQDGDPAVYAALMDRVYGPGATVVSLSDDNNWAMFRRFAGELPRQQVHPAIAWGVESGSAAIKGWRWMDVGFRIDQFIIHSLIYPAVGTQETPRSLPSGLDVMAVLGSQTARQAMESAGETRYVNYVEQTGRLQERIAQQNPVAWSSTAHSAWLYVFQAQLAEKDETYPAPMRTASWAIKDLNSALGSWAELQRDPSATPGEARSVPGDGRPVSAPAPAYVEPSPQVFYRLSHLANVAATGLIQRDMQGMFSTQPGADGLKERIVQTFDLGDRLARLGDIAARELSGIAPSDVEREIILAPLGPADEQDGAPASMAAITALAGAQGRALQVGNGNVDRIYVVVPIDGQLYIAQGGVFSYYEFPQSFSRPLSKVEWRQILVDTPPELPAWTTQLYLPDGNPVDVLAFRVGDTYRTTPAAGKLNVRQEPQRFSEIAYTLRPGEYLQIADGPFLSGGDRWWKIRAGWLSGQPVDGWVMENQKWFERAWGQ